MIVGVVSLYGIIFSLSRMNRQQPNDANKLEKALAVIFGNILSQGINCHKIRLKQFDDHEFRLNDINARISGSLSTQVVIKYRQLVVRFFVGCWCLSCFVIVTAYSSVLVSFLTAPDNTFSPLVNSVNDLLNKTKIRVTVDKGMIADILFKV
jgi:hypothetical protein